MTTPNLNTSKSLEDEDVSLYLDRIALYSIHPPYRLESKSGDLRNHRKRPHPRFLCTAFRDHNQGPSAAFRESTPTDWPVFMLLLSLEMKDADEEFQILKVTHRKKWPYNPACEEHRCECCQYMHGMRWKVPYGWDKGDFWWVCKECKRLAGQVARMHISGPDSLFGYAFWHFFWDEKSETIRRAVWPTAEERDEDMSQSRA